MSGLDPELTFRPRKEKRTVSSKKSNGSKSAVIRIQLCGMAVFGDRENGRVSQGGWFTVNGVEFVSEKPVSREHAAEINREMTTLRKALGQ